MSSNHPPWDPDELEMNKVAYLSVFERDPTTGKPPTQSELAKRLGITREQANRYVQQARRSGVLRSEYAPPSDAMLDRVRLELNYADITGVLQAFATSHAECNDGRKIQSVTVIADGLQADRRSVSDEGILRFGPPSVACTQQFVAQAARYASPSIGVAWGRTLRSIVDAFVASGFSWPRGRPQVECVPLWGEAWGPDVPEWKGPIFTDRQRLSSSSLARDLEAKLTKNQTARRRRSLDAVPVMLPRELAEHRELLQQYLCRVSAWGEVFGAPHPTGTQARVEADRPLAERLHLILASAGSPANPGRFLSPEVLRNALDPKDADRLAGAVHGDVAGVLLARERLSPSDERLLSEIHNCWTGVREEHLRLCAEKASRNEGVGVVVYAVHKQRAQPVLEGVRRGLITHLVIDTGLATELSRLATSSIR